MKEVDLRKYKTKSSANVIIEKLDNVETEDILTGIFIKSDYDESEHLIKLFEKQLIVAKLRKGDFKGGLYKFFKSTSQYIKKNRLFREFFKIAYDINVEMEKKHANRDVINAYLSLIMEQVSYLENEGKTICGITKNGDTIECDEIYPKFEKPIIELMISKDKPNNPKRLFELAKKKYKLLGYNIETLEDYHIYVANQQLITNMLFHLAYLINEEYMDIIADVHFLPCLGIKGDIRINHPTSFYIEALKVRKYTIPSKGLICKINDVDSISELFIMERFIDDKVVMLYRLDMSSGGSTSGFYDIKENYFFSIWRNSDVGANIHANVENIVLESYCRATTNKVDEVEGHNRRKEFEFYYKINRQSGDLETKAYDKNKYIEKVTTVKPYVRKLPAGAKASEEAKRLAIKYGYELEKDETFVSSFKKSVNTVKHLDV